MVGIAANTPVNLQTFRNELSPVYAPLIQTEETLNYVWGGGRWCFMLFPSAIGANAAFLNFNANAAGRQKQRFHHYSPARPATGMA